MPVFHNRWCWPRGCSRCLGSRCARPHLSAAVRREIIYYRQCSSPCSQSLSWLTSRRHSISTYVRQLIFLELNCKEAMFAYQQLAISAVCIRPVLSTTPSDMQRCGLRKADTLCDEGSSQSNRTTEGKSSALAVSCCCCFAFCSTKIGHVDCPGRKPPFLAVKRPACPYKLP